MDSIFNEIEGINNNLKNLEQKIENADKLSRDLVRLCGAVITLMHRNDPNAESELGKAKNMAEKLYAMDYANENMINGALQEYAEACIFYSIIKNKTIPKPDEVMVGDKAYLSGLMDAVGELKREVFESLAKNEVEQARLYTGIMQDIYDSCRGIRFQEHILPGFRRKQDVARILVESCTSELLRFKNM